MNFSSWRSILSSYSSRDVAAAHVNAVLEAFKGLLPKPDSFKYENGITAKLLSLFGTLEITYKNKNYNIPICIWLPLNYPLSAPIIYVKPTPNMLIRTSKYVDTAGKVYHPQLAYWKQDSSLLLFLRVIQQIFSLEPPVYSKPPNSSPSTFSSNPPIGQSSSAYPSTAVPSYSKPQSSAINFTNHPSNKPSTSQSQSPPISQNHSNWRPSGQIQKPNPKEEEISKLRAKLAERINQKSTSFFQMLDRASQEQLMINRQLISSHEEVDTSLKQLNLSCSNLRQNIASLMNMNETVSEAVKVIEKMPDPDFNVVGDAQPVLYKQIFDAVAEARAIDDCIYQLTNSFSAESMDINVFIKNLKSLARDEFFKKALILKIRSSLGLNAEL